MRRTIAALAWLLMLRGAALAGPPPPESLPDWSGVWGLRGGTLFDRSTAVPPDGDSGAAYVRERPPYNAEWEKKYLANIEKVAKTTFPDPNQLCGLPTGFPRIFNMPEATEFIVRPEETWVVTEIGPNVVRIYTDGRDHPPPDELFPTYGGDSVGHWEGETLVFDTVGVKGDGFQLVDRTGVVTSDKLHVTTRMGLVGRDLMRIDMTLEDPLAFTAPWKVTKTYVRLPPTMKAYEYACAENNRNPVDAEGYTLMMGPGGKPVNAPRPPR
jgi:hypothetical protein